jgi:hypothetical protein
VVTGKGVHREGEVRRWRRSSSGATSSSNTSAASLPFVIHAGEFQRCFNLHQRPFLRSGVAFFAGFEASGAVPALESDGGITGLVLIGGERERLDSFSYFSARSFLQKLGTYV